MAGYSNGTLRGFGVRLHPILLVDLRIREIDIPHPPPSRPDGSLGKSAAIGPP